MKTHHLIIGLLLLFVISLSSCDFSATLVKATGVPYEIVVVMDKANWEQEAGAAVKGELQSPIPGLPQIEPAFKITYVTPDQFNGLLTYVKNILLVNVNNTRFTKTSVSYERDRWAQGQVVATLNTPDGESLAEFMDANQNSLTGFFTGIEMKRTGALLEKTYSTTVMDNAKNLFDVMLNAPTDMVYNRIDKDFFWASNNAISGRTDMIIYSFPYRDADTFTQEYLVAKRDSVLKANLPGAFPNSYMTTETRGLTYTPITVRGKYCGVLRGLWKMVGDMMGGPFVSHFRLDEEYRRVVVVEGFVYAPEVDKRNYIRRIEAALYTLRLPGEFDQPAVESAASSSVEKVNE
ncbi:MAG: DUF4837 family protein [Tannerellaceae bacterium]|jgi:hypothetical protein|nr:DUF4837 family protein [Tannerellaceae bacterium]